MIDIYSPEIVSGGAVPGKGPLLHPAPFSRQQGSVSTALGALAEQQTEMGRVEIISFLLLAVLTAKAHSNTMPEIDISSVVRIREDIPIDGYAFTINATDADGDTLTYGLRGSDSEYFRVDPATGVVRVKAELDRETHDILSFEVTVEDNVNPNPKTKKIHVVLLDANDNWPVFERTPYNVKLPENTTIDSPVCTVLATDRDSGSAGVVSYSISEVTPSDGASLFEIGEKSGIITLIGELDFAEKSTFYQLKVTAQDGGGQYQDDFIYQSRSAFVFVTVEDVPDLDPQFLNLPSTVMVEEGSPVGTTVFKVRARDPDTGVHSPIQFTITNASVADLFEIQLDGTIIVKNHLDREQHLNLDGVITLQIEAKEVMQNVHGVNAAATSEIQITIGDVNDERPMFYHCVTTESCAPQNAFTGNIDEHSAAGLPVLDLNMEVLDNDKGENATFRLSLEGQGKDAFSVSPSLAVSKAQVQILMRSPADVDYEKTTSMDLRVIAVDSKKEDFKSTAQVTITINDRNDNMPAFGQETYNLEVEEGSPAGTKIETITATDPDSEDVGQIVYKLLPESMLKYFNVSSTTGTITVQNGELLDREGRSLYSATLQARDKANNTGTAILEIKLLDKNDNAPKMIRDLYIEFVNEGPGVTFELQIQAIDNDEPDTNNSKIEYKIADGPSAFSNNFTIDKDTGILTLSGELDREALDPELNGVITLNITAFDKGTPPLGTWAEVKINVGDINDNWPLFKTKTYDFQVKESEKGAFINSVLAKDQDQTTMNNRISFSIDGGSSGTFSIRSVPVPDNAGYWGNISVDQDIELDYETRTSYDFTVVAQDSDHRDVATVHLEVLDVNDETPVIKAGVVLTLKENTTLEGGVVGRVEGEDEDTQHKLTYELLSTECSCNESGACREEWFLVEPSGNVTIKPEYVVDYEQCHEVILHVRVTDDLTEVGKNSSDGKIFIKIEDINDNAPEFIQIQPNFVVVAENTEKDTSVARVSATDRDSAENSIMSFEVLTVRFINNNNQTEGLNKIFRAEDLTQTSSNREGIIRSLQSLSPEMRGRYVITVQVKDQGGLASTSEVVLFTVDKSFRVSLEFKSTVEDFIANEATIKWALESATGTTVHVVNRQEKSSRSASVTVVDAYFIYPNGTALRHDTVLNMVNGNGNTEFRDVLFQQGLSGVNAGAEDPVGEGNMEMYVLLALMGGLAIVLVVMTTLLVFMRRNYQRKLKAAKAMNSATMDASDNGKSGPVVPGTNKYTMEGANPVLNINFDSVTDLGFDEEDSNADRASLNSLDNIDMNMSEKLYDTLPMRVIEEEDEESGPDGHYYEALGAALAERGGRKKGRTDSPSLTFANPAANTTDL